MFDACAGRPGFPRKAGFLAFRTLLLGTLLATPVSAADPGPSPHRFIPARGLVAYAEFDGLDAHAEAWKATAASALLDRTTAGAMMRELARQVTDRLLRARDGGKQAGADVIAVHDHLTRHGFAVAVFELKGNPASFGVVLNGVGRDGPRGRFERLFRLGTDPAGRGKIPTPVRFRGRDLYQVFEVARGNKPPGPAGRIETAAPARLRALEDIRLVANLGEDKRPDPIPVPPTPGGGRAAAPWLSWWFEGVDLIVIAAPNGAPADRDVGDKKTSPAFSHNDQVAAVLDTIEGTEGNASSHPGYSAARAAGKDIQGFQPDGLFFAEPEAIGLLIGLQAAGGGGLPHYRGVVLPTAPYMKGDVPYFAPGPDFPWANTQAATQRARMQAMGMKVPPPALAVPTKSLPSTRADAPSTKYASVPGRLTPIGSPVSSPPPPEVPKGVSDLQAPSPSPFPLEAGLTHAKRDENPAPGLASDGIKRVVGRWGFQGKALVTDLRVETIPPPKGIVGLLDQPGFRKDRLPPIPRGVVAFTVGSLDLGKSYPRLVTLLDSCGLASGEIVVQVEQVLREGTGLRLREDVLSHLGPTWCAYRLPSLVKDGKSGVSSHVLLSGLDDAAGFGKVVDTIAARFNAYIRKEEAGDDGKDEGGRAAAPMLALEPLKAPERGYRLTSPAGLVPWLSEMFQPTVLIGTSHVAFATDPARAREALVPEGEAGGRWEPTGELVKTFAGLPETLTFLSVGDPKDSAWPGLIANLPVLVQTMGSALDDSDAPSTSNVLAGLGISRPGGFRVRVDPDQVPRADDLRAPLFPGVVAVAGLDGGFRLVSREAFPFTCLGGTLSLQPTMRWTSKDGFTRDVKFQYTFGD